MTTQTEAERLADALEKEFIAMAYRLPAAAELRRLVSFNQQLMDEVARLQKREWVGLTLEEIDTEWGLFMSGRGSGYIPDFVHAIEAKLKEKNT